MQEVFGQHGFSQAVGANQDDVGGLLDEAQCEQLIQQLPIQLSRPGVVEVSQVLEGAQVSVIQAPLEASFLPLRFFDVQHPCQPGLVDDLLGVGQKAEQILLLQTLAQRLKGECRRLG